MVKRLPRGSIFAICSIGGATAFVVGLLTYAHGWPGFAISTMTAVLAIGNTLSTISRRRSEK